MHQSACQDCLCTGKHFTFLNSELFTKSRIQQLSACRAATDVRISSALTSFPAVERSVVFRLAARRSGAGQWLCGQTMAQGVRTCEMIGATLLHGVTFHFRLLFAEDRRQPGALGLGIAATALTLLWKRSRVSPQCRPLRRDTDRPQSGLWKPQ